MRPCKKRDFKDWEFIKHSFV